MTPARDDLHARARRFAALGDPIRLGLVDELARSDRSPKELTAHFSLASNLLAHHLDVLEHAGLVERIVSAGDRRRRYIRLTRAGRDHLDPASTQSNPGSALFVCSHNSARSQLAAALWRRTTNRPATSAGTHPAERVHPGARAAARRAGLDLDEAQPRLLESGQSADIVVTVCDRAHEEIEVDEQWWHWSLPDPVEAGGRRAFDATLEALDDRIRSVTPTPSNPEPHRE